MFLSVFGILIVGVLSASSQMPFRVDIVISPKDGRNETDDITFLHRALSDADGVKVVFAKKAFDNKRFITVLEVQEIRCWSFLTSHLSERDYTLSVTPLQSCNNYAMELGVNVTYHGENDVLQSDVVSLFDVVFYDKVAGMKCREKLAISMLKCLSFNQIESVKFLYDKTYMTQPEKGMNTEEYIATMKDHFERDKVRQSQGSKLICYRSYGELPIRLFYLKHLVPNDLEKIYKAVRIEGRTSVVVELLQ